MIDVESELFTLIATALRSAYSGIFVTGEYVPAPASFPAVSIVEMDNTAYRPTQDSASVENDAEVVYEVNVYSNRAKGKKAEAKAITALIDGQFANLGFSRVFLNQTQNMNDATIYRMTGRYRAVVSKDKIIYRR